MAAPLTSQPSRLSRLLSFGRKRTLAQEHDTSSQVDSVTLLYNQLQRVWQNLTAERLKQVADHALFVRYLMLSKKAALAQQLYQLHLARQSQLSHRYFEDSSETTNNLLQLLNEIRWELLSNALILSKSSLSANPALQREQEQLFQQECHLLLDLLPDDDFAHASRHLLAEKSRRIEQDTKVKHRRGSVAPHPAGELSGSQPSHEATYEARYKMLRRVGSSSHQHLTQKASLSPSAFARRMSARLSGEPFFDEEELSLDQRDKHETFSHQFTYESNEVPSLIGALAESLDNASPEYQHLATMFELAKQGHYGARFELCYLVIFATHTDYIAFNFSDMSLNAGWLLAGSNQFSSDVLELLQEESNRKILKTVMQNAHLAASSDIARSMNVIGLRLVQSVLELSDSTENTLVALCDEHLPFYRELKSHQETQELMEDLLHATVFELNETSEIVMHEALKSINPLCLSVKHMQNLSQAKAIFSTLKELDAKTKTSISHKKAILTNVKKTLSENFVRFLENNNRQLSAVAFETVRLFFAKAADAKSLQDIRSLQAALVNWVRADDNSLLTQQDYEKLREAAALFSEPLDRAQAALYQLEKNRCINRFVGELKGLLKDQVPQILKEQFQELLFDAATEAEGGSRASAYTELRDHLAHHFQTPGRETYTAKLTLYEHYYTAIARLPLEREELSREYCSQITTDEASSAAWDRRQTILQTATNAVDHARIEEEKQAYQAEIASLDISTYLEQARASVPA